MSLKDGMKVRVYFNLHKKVWSVQCSKTRLVIAHLEDLTLEQVCFKVSESGRQRVLREKAKNVHAFATGIFRESSHEGSVRVSYNPYRFGHFYMAEDKRQPCLPLPVHKANKARLKGRHVWI